jgi:hypothetical protein
MGLSSLFLDSLALRPTKDNFFSTDSSGEPDSQGGENKGAALSVLARVLPFEDAIRITLLVRVKPGNVCDAISV